MGAHDLREDSSRKVHGNRWFYLSEGFHCIPFLTILLPSLFTISSCVFSVCQQSDFLRRWKAEKDGKYVQQKKRSRCRKCRRTLTTIASDESCRERTKIPSSAAPWFVAQLEKANCRQLQLSSKNFLWPTVGCMGGGAEIREWWRCL